MSLFLQFLSTWQHGVGERMFRLGRCLFGMLGVAILPLV